MGGGGSKGATVTFQLTPNVPVGTASRQPIVLTHCFEWHCIDDTDQSCLTNVFIDCGDVTGDFFSYARTNPSCWPFTVLIINKGGYDYDMTGTVLREFANGATTPFASGTYSKFEVGGGGGQEFGTFTYHEGALTIDSSEICPSQ